MAQESTKMFDDEFKKSIKSGLRTGALVASFLAPILIVVTTLGIVSSLLGGGTKSQS